MSDNRDKSRILFAAALALIALAGCETPASSFPPAPTPATDAMPPPPVVGHWVLEGSPTGEHLWIEADGTFTEAGGAPLRAGSLEGLLSSGGWSWSAMTMTLTLDDVSGRSATGSIARDGALVLTVAPHLYRFDRESGDAGAD